MTQITKAGDFTAFQLHGYIISVINILTSTVQRLKTRGRLVLLITGFSGSHVTLPQRVADSAMARGTNFCFYFLPNALQSMKTNMIKLKKKKENSAK